MSRLALSLACWNYDRTRALMDGSVAAGRHRPHVSQPAGGGDVLPHAAQPRVRRGRDVAVVVHRVDVPRAAAVRGDPDIPVALFPPLVDLHQRERGHPRAQGSHRQAHRHAGVPDDGAGMDSRHPRRALRRARRQRHVLHRRRGGAGTRREDQARPARRASGSCRSGRRRRSRRCSRTARSTRCTPRACPRRSRCGRTAVRRLFPNYEEVEQRVLPQDRHLPDHAHRGDPSRAVRGESLDRAVALQGVRRRAARRPTKTCTSRPR